VFASAFASAFLSTLILFPTPPPQASIKHVLKDKFANYEKGPNFREALGEVSIDY
jgi:hypothetical protein